MLWKNVTPILKVTPAANVMFWLNCCETAWLVPFVWRGWTHGRTTIAPPNIDQPLFVHVKPIRKSLNYETNCFITIINIITVINIKPRAQKTFPFTITITSITITYNWRNLQKGWRGTRPCSSLPKKPSPSPTPTSCESIPSLKVMTMTMAMMIVMRWQWQNWYWDGKIDIDRDMRLLLDLVATCFTPSLALACLAHMEVFW